MVCLFCDGTEEWGWGQGSRQAKCHRGVKAGAIRCKWCSWLKSTPGVPLLREPQRPLPVMSPQEHPSQRARGLADLQRTPLAELKTTN